MTQPRSEAYRVAEETYDVETFGQFAMHHEHGLRAAVDAVWKLADDAGYRRAVQALRDEASRTNGNGNLTAWAVYLSAADFLDAAAPRNEGEQT